MITKKGFYLIKGNAGTGKSTLLRSTTVRMISDFEIHKSENVPFFIKLKMLVRNFVEPADKFLYDYFNREYNIDGEYFNKLIKENHLVFFLDGLDELVTDDEKNAFNQLLEQITKITATVILSSRNQKLSTDENLSKFEEWKINDFSFNQIKNFLNKWFNKENNELVENLKDHNLLDKLPSTPLVMTLLAILFDVDSNV